MVENHYRWDFIGLSTDEKPTPETSEKVTDGSTFYCSDTSKLYVFCEGVWYEKVAQGGGGGGTSDFNQLSNRPKYNSTTMTGDTNIPKVPTKTSELSNDSNFVTSGSLATVATTGAYSDLTGTPTIPAAQVNSDWNASSGVAEILNKPTIPTVNDATLTITQNGTSKGTFTANDADDTTIALTDTTYSAFTGTDGTAAGTAGLVPAPATTDAGKFLKADGTWDTAGGGSGPTVVQTTGTSTADVMSQKATSDMVYVPGYDPVTAPSTWALGLGKYAYVGAGPSFTVGRADSGSFRSRTYNDMAINILGGDNIGQGSITLGAGSHNKSGDSWNIAIGADAATGGHSTNNVVLGSGAVSADSANGAIALGSYSSATYTGEMNIGSSQTSYGYNNSNYRLLTGLYDPQNAHDAATKGYVDPTTDSSAPTTSTVGRLGQIQIDTTNADAYMCVAVDSVTPSYTWKKISV